MITLGITGRSGCGKSTVSSILKKNGVRCADGDAVSQQILLPGSPLLPKLAEVYGEDILAADGSLNRRLLAERAFVSADAKRRLEELTHPEILRRIREQKDRARLDGERLFLIDGALLIGTPFEKECDCIAAVTAPYEASIGRIMKRDGISRESAVKRLAVQMPEEELVRRSDFEIRNDAGTAELEQKTLQLVRLLLSRDRAH